MSKYLIGFGLLIGGYLALSFFNSRSSAPRVSRPEFTESSTQQTTQNTSVARQVAMADRTLEVKQIEAKGSHNPSALRRKNPMKSQSVMTEDKAEKKLPASPFTRNIEASNADQFKQMAPVSRIQASASLNPRDNHWVDGLSGAGARLDINKEAGDKACYGHYTYGCERGNNPQDAVLAGVVVRQERLAASHANLLNGKVKRGHYLNHTPAVFID